MSRYAMSKYEETLDAVRRVWESHHDITPQDDDCPKWETVTVPQTEERKEG